MAGRSESVKFIKNHPRISGGVAVVALALGGVMLAGAKVALDNGLNIFAPTGESTPAPWIPGAPLPDQNPSDDESTCAIKPEAGCLVVREDDTPAGLLARSGEKLYDGKEIRVIFSAEGHGGGEKYFPASTLADLAPISDVIWPCDQVCFENPIRLGFAQQNNGVRTGDTCVTVGPGDTAGSIFARTSQVPDGYKDALRINGVLHHVRTKAEFADLPDLIQLGSEICPE